MLKPLMDRFVPSVGSVLLCLGILGTAKVVEPIVFPVVEDFRITEINYQSDKVILSGVLNQLRGCTFVDMNAYAIYQNKEIPKDLLQYTFRANTPRSRSVGKQAWGPWRIELPVMQSTSQIELTAVYRCHSLWDTHQVLTKFLVV